jgi:ABC-type multidrug transport system fused ATPase/permease subunit
LHSRTPIHIIGCGEVIHVTFDVLVNRLTIIYIVNRWLSIRFNLLSCGIATATAFACLITPSINASLAGFALAFANTITADMLFMVRRFVGLEQSMVALERVKEYSELPREPPEFIEPRPPASWPSAGAIECQDLVIQYAVCIVLLLMICVSFVLRSHLL